MVIADAILICMGDEFKYVMSELIYKLFLLSQFDLSL